MSSKPEQVPNARLMVLAAALMLVSALAGAQAVAAADPIKEPEAETPATPAAQPVRVEDDEARVRRVYEMLASPAYGRKGISQTVNSFIEPMSELRLVDGKLMARNEYKRIYSDSFPPKKFVPEWFPVAVQGRSYVYRFTYYQCDMVGSRAERAPPYCPFDVSVRGEIVSLDPPTLREVLTVTASWSSSPSPAGCPTGISEYVSELVPR